MLPIGLSFCGGTATNDDGGPDLNEDVAQDADAGVTDGGGEFDSGEPHDPLWWHQAWPAPEGAPFPTCDDVDPSAPLYETAAYYDWITRALHMLPEGEREGSLIYSLALDTPGPTEITDGELPSQTFRRAGNAGLWGGLYLASQAFRYATTGDEEALSNVRRVITGTLDLMRITATPGLFARDFQLPSIPGMECPPNDTDYVIPSSSTELDRDPWLKLDENGCFMTWDPEAENGAGAWTTDEAHCAGTDFAGGCWRRWASKDGYAGSLFGLGVVAKLVEVEDVRAQAIDLIDEITEHIVEHDLRVVDYDGLPTRFGRVYALALDDYPGLNAIMALSWVRQAATLTGDPELIDYYHRCLLQREGERECIEGDFQVRDYRTWLEDIGLKNGCDTNYDNISMAMLAYFNLIWLEPDEDRRAEYRELFVEATQGPDDADGRDMWADGNPFFNYILASMMEGEHADEAAVLLDDAACSLKRFPSDLFLHAQDNFDQPEVCTWRNTSLAAEVISIEKRCQKDDFIWWKTPYKRESCMEDLQSAESPASFLLPYWMARYFGFLDETI